jgi:hypothetical protein
MANFFQLLYTGKISVQIHQMNHFQRATADFFSQEEHGTSDLLLIKPL